MNFMIIATLAAFFVKGLCGFASSLVFSTILSFGINNINITPVDLLLKIPSNLIIAWKERHAVKLKVSLPLAAFVLIGDIPGIFLLKYADANWIKIFFGAVIICMGCGMLSGKEEKEDEGKNRSDNGKGGLKPVYIFLGIASGVLCGMYGIGALLAVYVSRVTNNNREFKATICMAYIVDNIFRFILYVATEIITLQVARQAVLLLPFMLTGLFAGMKSSRYMEEKMAKRVMNIVLVISGAALIMKTALLYFQG